MAISNPALSPVLRLLLAQEVPGSVRHVVMTVPESTGGKLLFNVVRHVLNLNRYDAATTIDLQRLQMCSQLIGVVRLCCSIFPIDLLRGRLSFCSPLTFLVFPPCTFYFIAMRAFTYFI